MADRATPNLPARDFDETAQFYEALGFSQTWRDRAWMILTRGSLQLEFFPHPDLDPSASWFSAYLRLSDPPGSMKLAGRLACLRPAPGFPGSSPAPQTTQALSSARSST